MIFFLPESILILRCAEKKLFCITEVNKMKRTGILFITALLFVSMAFIGCKKSETAATEETVVQEETVVEPAVEEAVVADEAAAAVVEEAAAAVDAAVADEAAVVAE